ncbi:MAG: YihY family inner membrane protein [Phycisphaeraceae bacterium]|nr:YihY family inner membrane protein [Phycisphaeraceae bacterium]
MPILHHLLKGVEQFLSPPPQDASAPRRWIYSIFRLARYCYGQLIADRATQMAAALTYRTLFSLLPTIVLALVVLQGLRGLEHYQDRFKTSILNLIPDKLLSADLGDASFSSPSESPGKDQSPTTSTSPQPSQTAEEAAAATSLVERRTQLGSMIQNVLDALGKVDFRGIGSVGFLLFIYGATTLLETIERSFNVIFGAEQGRPWYLRITFYYTFITLGPIVLITGQIIQQKALSALAAEALTSWLAGPAVVLSPLLTSWFVLTAVYVLLPHARVQWKPALIGSFVASVLYVAGQQLFAIYVSRNAVTSLYGALGLVPLFLFWIYITWLIVLFGLELTYALQTIKSSDFDEELNRPQHEILGDSQWLLPIMARIGQSFAQGKTIDAQDLAHEVGLPLLATMRVCSRLQQAGLVHPIDQSEGSAAAYALARPPDRIPLDHLLELGQNWTRPDRSPPADQCWQFARQLDVHQRQAAAGKTLADILPSTSPG